jgi:hypothetical protein
MSDNNVFTTTLQNIPDSAKVVTATAAPVLTLFGVSVEEWTYILSIIVSLLFIIEKIPVMVSRAKALKEWIYAKRKK